MQTVTLSLHRFRGAAGRAWALAQMGLSRAALARQPGLRFWKLCGSGTGEGFTPLPNTGVYAILAVWDDARAAWDGTEHGVAFTRWRAQAAETWTLFLAPVSARGAWAGTAPFAPHGGLESGAPVAALTRASVRPAVAARFWARVPDISARIGADPNVLFKIGIGEVPLLHQVTFSIWPDTASMAAFARAGGPHAQAIAAVRDGDWFSEELYARFRIEASRGRWGGMNPLAAARGAHVAAA